MKMIFLRKRSVFLLLSAFMMMGTVVKAQTLTIKSSTMTIDGKTNVNHDYTTKVTQLSGEMTIVDNRLQSLTVEIPVRSIISGEKLMDKKTHETFNAPKNPMILFNMTEVNSMQVNGRDIAVTVTGNLSMGGATKKVMLKAAGKEVSPGVYTFEGALPLKISDFNMKPPTAMLGAMKTKDQVTVNYNVTFEGPAVNFNSIAYTQNN